ncbi:hypothetical protein OG21DRAFT_1495355 [Imleria badia]|nr:hypothetical protein OG21DRAFT_1495355 [Imleria badia]
MAGQSDTFILLLVSVFLIQLASVNVAILIVVYQLAWLFPPAAVAILAGCGPDLCLNILLTILAYLPGCLHAFWLVLRRADANERYGYKNWTYTGMGEYVPIQQGPPGAVPYGRGQPPPPPPPPPGQYPAGNVPPPSQAPVDQKAAPPPPPAPAGGYQATDQKAGGNVPPPAPTDQKSSGDQAPPQAPSDQKQGEPTAQSTAPPSGT